MSDIHVLSGAYALNALDDLERAQFQRHLTHCDTCQAEVDSLRETSVLMAGATAITPPADLRSRILGEIASVRPLPPITAATVTPLRSSRRWIGGLVAAAVIAVVGVGGSVWQPWNDSTSQNPQPSAADLVRDAPDAQTVVRKVEGGGQVTIVASKSLNEFVVVTKDLPALKQGTVYQMWLQDVHDGMLPAGLMTAEDSTVVLAGDVANAVGAGITVEPASGSRVPTTVPVALFEFEKV